MTVTPFPETIRTPIADAKEIAAVEALISGVAGVVSAMGGAVAIAGRDLFETDRMARAEALTEMYEGGEVVFGYLDGRDGAVVNIALERLAFVDGDPLWRAAVYEERPGEGHMLAGAIAERELASLAPRLLGAVSDQRASVPRNATADLARIALGR